MRCRILAYANDTEKNVTVTDYPSEHLFTVSMTQLQEKNTGWYWCAVERSGFQTDVTQEHFIEVKSDPAVSVLNHWVTAEDGGNLTIQCLYSAVYQDEPKQWCRSADWLCFSTVSPFNSSLTIRIDDDGKSFSLQITEVKKSDAGWFWCTMGTLQVPVYINVKNPSSATPVTAAHATKPTTSAMSAVLWSLVAIVLVMLLILGSILGGMLLRKQRVRNVTRTRENSQDTTPATPIDTSEEPVTYSEVIRKKMSDPDGQNHSFVTTAARN